MAGDKREKKNFHAGHRQRAKEEFLTRGLEGISDHRALELLLFYAIPQGDVNPLAHELIERFGTFSDVFTAPYEELVRIKGMGPNAATLIKLVPALWRFYESSRTQVEYLTTPEEYGAVLKPHFFALRSEECWMLCMDGKGKSIACCKLGEGILNQVSVPLRKVVETALLYNASQVVLAHNHVSGIALPSAPDLEYTRAVRQLLLTVEVRLVDHLIISDDDMVSLAQSGQLWDLR